MTESPPRPCPECGVATPVLSGWVTWCDACGWNVDPTPPPQPSGALARWRRRGDRAVTAVHERVLRAGPADTGWVGAVATLSALPVHLLTLALVAAAARVAVADVATAVRVVLLVTLAGVLSQIVPWPGRAPAGAGVLAAADAPASFAVVGQVAAALGTRAPHRIVVTGAFNASYGFAGPLGRRVLVIGHPLWDLLDDPQKLALLGHELGHAVSHDARRQLLPRTAAHSLRGWHRLLADDGYRRWRPVVRPHGGSLVALAQLIVTPLVLAARAVVALAGAGIERLTRRAGQTAEYRADLAAVRVAGPDAVAGLLGVLLLDDYVAFARTAARNRGADVRTAMRQALADLPARERDRLERRSRGRLTAVDGTHPPTHYRLDLVRGRPPADPAVRPDPASLRAMDGELLRAAGR